MSATRNPIFLLAALTACTSSNPDNVCYDIGLCETQYEPQIAACRAQAAELGGEAFDAGCGPAYDSYFACANGAYTCDGNRPFFPGCEGKLSTLDACLQAAQASTSCGALAAALAKCPGYDAGDSGPIPSPCTSAGVCSANCYLANVPNVCAPIPAQLASFQSCASVCM
jgi:hypothetical protein